MMLIQDSIYGQFEISDPVALALIATPTFQRLHQISQFGLPDELYHLKGYSRFEHSLGVYHLLSLFGASQVEQLSGLLHDVSHTAFSHLVDWVVGNPATESYQDDRHLSVLQLPDISSVLHSYGFSAIQMADYTKFGLLEQDLPLLCADRLDYALRESNPQLAQLVLADLQPFDGKLLFTSPQIAKQFALHFMSRQENHWSGYEAVTRYVVFAELLQQALKDGVIVMADFSQTDQWVLEKIRKVKSLYYTKVLSELTKNNLSHLPKSKQSTTKKLRYVDPLVMTQSGTLQLSGIDDEFATHLSTFKNRQLKGVIPGQISFNLT